MTHTPGPWFVSNGAVFAPYVGHDDESVCIARMDRSEFGSRPTERDANANLIAAAPAMLAWLQKYVEGDSESGMAQEARALLRAVEG